MSFVIGKHGPVSRSNGASVDPLIQIDISLRQEAGAHALQSSRGCSRLWRPDRKAMAGRELAMPIAVVPTLAEEASAVLVYPNECSPSHTRETPAKAEMAVSEREIDQCACSVCKDVMTYNQRRQDRYCQLATTASIRRPLAAEEDELCLGKSCMRRASTRGKQRHAPSQPSPRLAYSGSTDTGSC